MNDCGVGIHRPLTCSSSRISAVLVEGKPRYAVSGRCIVLNLGHDPIGISDSTMQSLPPLQSTIVIDAELHQVGKILVISIANDVATDRLIDELGWHHYASLIEAPSDELQATPLFRSNQDNLGLCEAHASALGVTSTGEKEIERFDIKVNFWFAPSGTNCLIHRYHPFVETHLQVHGLGRMQKFRSPAIKEIYEEMFLSPGSTQPFFNCIRDDANGFIYPWHQYYADTDCIWMAIEFHPLANAAE